MKNRKKGQRTVLGTRNLDRILYVIPIFLLLAGSVRGAYGDWWAGWNPDIDGSKMAKGGETYMTPLINPTVNSGTVSSWMGAKEKIDALDQWIQIGWYKGAAIGDQCPVQTAMTIYVESHIHPLKFCNTFGQVNMNEGHWYTVYNSADLGGGFWRWRAELDGVLKATRDLQFPKGRIDANIQVRVDSTNTADSRFSILSYLSDSNVWKQWENRFLFCAPNKYVTEFEFQWYQFRAYSSTSGTCS